MSKVAVLSDIHGNTFALEAVLADIEAAEVDECIIAGDLVGRGPFGSAVVERVAELGWPVIRGNHEDYLLNFIHKRVPLDWWTLDEWAASRWMAAELGPEHIAFIEELPLTTTSTAHPGLRIVHGSPRSYNEGLGDWTSDDDLARHIDGVKESVLVCAHTHRAMHRRVANGEVVNVGAVGLPFNGDTRAQYAIFVHDDSRWTVEFRKVPYDRDALVAAYHDSGFLGEGGITAELLLREVESARSFLVPFMKWAEALGRSPSQENLPDFDAVYDPEGGIGAFIEMVRRQVAGL